MQILLYNLCFLFTKAGTEVFVITDMQTNDTLTFATSAFSAKKEIQLYEAELLAKPKIYLSYKQFLEFNGCKFQFESDTIIIV